ncbi:papain family cysteine protease domain-containing protein [Ditylenchus destructor]|uniref:Papain family cysteine protease domain-containing protein n=1 Tax=Ditylenchus destructor TaxID=166010 RepID=A0AAD4N6I7_9BILA|nr:papain family cysteine protease domain-containing protein [Ditylenchus destructor]
MNAAKRVCFSIGALTSFLILILLSCLILYVFLKSSSIEKSKDATEELLSGNLTYDPALHLKRKSEELVHWINTNSDSMWQARLNPHAVGLKSDEETETVIYQSNLVMQNKMRELEQMKPEAVYEQYDKHLRSLEQQKRPIPSHFNAAKRWPNCSQNILKVRDQGGCGSCWAVAATSVISDRICIASKEETNIVLSAQALIECCSYCGACNGTMDPLLPFVYWVEHGLASEECYPYTVSTDCGSPCRPETFYSPKGVFNCSNTCKGKGPYVRHFGKYIYKIGSLSQNPGIEKSAKTLSDRFQEIGIRSKKAPKSVEELVKREMMAHGPTMLCFNVFEDFMHYYDGVYDYLHGFPRDHIYDHCVKLIGWGLYKHNGTGQIEKYFTAVNSWGKWGVNGAFKIDLRMLQHFRSDLYAGIPVL